MAESQRPATDRLDESFRRLERALAASAMRGSSINVIHAGTGLSWTLAAAAIAVMLALGWVVWKMDDRVTVQDLKLDAHERRLNKLEKETD